MGGETDWWVAAWSHVRPEIVGVGARGQRRSAWQVGGKDLHVSSVYGSSGEPLGRRKPVAVATRLPINQVNAWPRQRA